MAAWCCLDDSCDRYRYEIGLTDDEANERATAHARQLRHRTSATVAWGHIKVEPPEVVTEEGR